MTAKKITKRTFHYGEEARASGSQSAFATTESAFEYKFQNFFHPRVGNLIAILNRGRLADIMDPTTLDGLSEHFFDSYYTASPNARVTLDPFPLKEVDVELGGPYANYNWELLFHFPVAVASHLSKSQRFADAQRWFHYVFDPTCTDTSVDPPARYWKFLRFRHRSDMQNIYDILELIATPDDECNAAMRELKDRALAGYDYILRHPFQPHAIARTRLIAYQYMVVMKYLDNLIAWGDNLFAQDTVETINEATQIYIFAANLLGPRPQRVPPVGASRPRTFADLRGGPDGLDGMSNALVDLEAQFPFNVQGGAPAGGNASGAATPLFGIGRTLYFSIPRNTKLLTYWDTVADRLYKIRNSLNLQGVFRQLALFDPPIDPGMLVKAAAAGIDIGSIVSGLNQPVGVVRSLVLIQKALEIAGEVRGLGGALLSAVEKGDAEHLSRMRQAHEIRIEQLTQDVRFLQWKQAEASTEALMRTRSATLERFHYYQRLLGIADDGSQPDALTADRRELTEENFDEAWSALVGAYDKPAAARPYPPLLRAGDLLPSTVADAGKLSLTLPEAMELNVLMPTAAAGHLAASAVEAVAGILTFIPEITVDLQYWGLGASPVVFGGSKLAEAARVGANVVRAIAGAAQDAGAMAARVAGYERRVDEWYLQYNLAARELVQIGRQLLGSLIAEQLAKHEYETTKTQIDQSQEVAQFLADKFSNEELYGWMQGETSRLFYEYYRFAVDTARRAERTMKKELMRPDLTARDFIQFNYWDGGRKGLLSGEALWLDVKRMELAYHDNNRREYELTRHVSLRQLDPMALLSLRTTGKCEITLPESLFDRDCPGHYMRRIRSVGLSIPSVVGPYTSLNCTLTLLQSSLRVSSIVPQGGDYARDLTSEDDRFVDYFGAVESVVTSGGVNDSGMFDTNLKDDRFLPFEGAGAISRWRIELPKDYRGFDYQTISDVILHVRYTARDGGQALAQPATTALTTELTDAATSSLAQLFSLKHDFPVEWAAFANASAGGTLSLSLTRELFPYMVQDYLAQGATKDVVVDSVTVYAARGRTLTPRLVKASEQSGGVRTALALTLAKDAVLTTDADVQPFLVVRYHLG